MRTAARAGLAAASAATALLFGVTPVDVPTFALAGRFLLAVAALAPLGPAARASRVGPMRTFRDQ